MTIWRGPAKSGRTTRLTRPAWSDPRLILGVLLVLGSTVLGATVVAASGSTTGYWAVRDDVKQGDPVERADLVRADAHVSGSAADQLMPVDEPLPERLGSLVWARDLRGGALVDQAALASEATAHVAELPLSVAAGAAPADLQRGDRVDVWVGPGPGDDTGIESARVLRNVRVVSTGGRASSLEGTAARTVLVDVSGVELDGDVVSTVSAAHVTMVRVS
jgi:hypothetical protein